ncbi:hypothetical protein MLD38_033207 [Melastoma candidum]|uniref:Uncharacterized protein n=1 Tax=Melastoma candidum TaxID=119954 RepID=A0ACB9M6G6_9MYRT|nr:hypothetical protein MLD38_033207 [Melastoma candidum]
MMIALRRSLQTVRGFSTATVANGLCADRLHHFPGEELQPRISLPGRYSTAGSEVVRCNWRITQLSRDGRMDKAREVFDGMIDRDVVTWTTVISGYVKCGMLDKAQELFDRPDARRNVVTWTAMLGGYVKLGRLSEARKLFGEMPEKNVVSWNTLLDGYARSGRVDEALDLFEKMQERNVVSWNTMITAFSHCGRIDEARGLFERMPQRDVISWTAMVAGLSRNGMIDEARRVFDEMPQKNIVSWNAMITGYAQNMRVTEAFGLFKRMPERDLPSWNAMITGLVQNGDLKSAMDLFEDMPHKNVVSWTTLINGYVQDGQNEQALRIFSLMLADDAVKPNQGTFVSVLGACSNSAGLSEGRQIHQIISKTTYQDNPMVVSALINMYSKCGELGTARKMFDDRWLGQKDIVSWNCMIAAYAHHGRGREAIGMFNKMRKVGFKPDDVSYIGLLSACSHAGLVEEGLAYFKELTEEKSIKLREDHLACLVDLCGRAGRVEEALELIKQQGNEQSASVWGALLAGCHFHRNTDIGKLAADKLLEIEPENAGTYLLLANIYASTGKWREAARVRLRMKGDGLKKQPGCSWIEVDNRFHVFVVRDKSHSQKEVIYHVLCGLHREMDRNGRSASEEEEWKTFFENSDF